MTLIALTASLGLQFGNAQIGTRFPSERKVVKDPVTGVDLVFLTSQPRGDSKMYPTHTQWTSDGKWIVFRSDRVEGEAMAVNEETGDIVQVTEGGYSGALNVARKSMKLYFGRPQQNDAPGQGDRRQPRAIDVIEVDLQALFDDSEAGTLKDQSHYQKVLATIPAEIGARGVDALDADEEFVYFGTGKEYATKFLPPYVPVSEPFGARNMGAGPSAIGKVDLKTKEISHVVTVPFQVGHIQANLWVPGEIVFCWETGGKAPQRTWVVRADGSELRPIYEESAFDWVTHEMVISADEIAVCIMGHRPIPGIERNDLGEATGVRGANPGQESEWGPSGTRAKPTGIAVINLRTRDMRIEGQTHHGSGLWHPAGSSDGRWLAADDFYRNVYLIDRNNHEMMLLTAGHKDTARDHTHPTFSPDGTKIEIQSAMLSEDDRSLNICVVRVPEDWLNRTYAFDFNKK